MADFRTQSSRFKMFLRNKETQENEGIGSLQMLEVVLYGDNFKKEWLKFKYPDTEGWENVTLEDVEVNGATKQVAVFEITPEMSKSAPLGLIIIQATYRITDSRFSTGYMQEVKKGKLQFIRDVV